MQDGAPIHTSRSTIAWLSDNNVVRFNLGVWPAHSPDFNPIEHIWPIVGRMLQGRVCKGREDLWAALKVAFAAVSPAQIIRLHDSMPRRMAAAMRAKGAATRY